MQPLSPGVRAVRSPNPALRPQARPPQSSFYTPPHAEILNTKAQLIRHREGLALARHHINELEAALSRIDPQRVVACIVPGYTDPPERVAAAERDKAAGFVTVVPDIVTVAAIEAGEMAPPEISGPLYSDIHATKQHIAQLRTMIAHGEAHNDCLEFDLSSAEAAKAAQT